MVSDVPEEDAVDGDVPPSRMDRARSALSALKGPLALAGSLVGVAVVPVWTVGLFEPTYKVAIQATYVCVTGLVFIGLAVYLQVTLTRVRRDSGRARRIAGAHRTIAAVFEHLSQAALHVSDGDRDAMKEEGNWACHRLAEAFSAITGSPCRATVKQAFRPGEGDRVAVKDLFRSHPATRRPPGHVDWVDENTDFEEIMAEGRVFWMCDDIIAEFDKRYRNSHVSRDQARRGDVPYRSVMVVRIASPGEGADVELAGFVCLDSLRPGIFRKQFDVSAVKSVSHALYSVLMWYRRAES